MSDFIEYVKDLFGTIPWFTIPLGVAIAIWVVNRERFPRWPIPLKRNNIAVLAFLGFQLGKSLDYFFWGNRGFCLFHAMLFVIVCIVLLIGNRIRLYRESRERAVDQAASLQVK